MLETTGLEVDSLVEMPEISDIADLYNQLCSHALQARQEEDVLKEIALRLRTHIGCDAIIFRLMERYIQTRVIALVDETRVVPLNRIKETWTQEDADHWRSLTDGIFCDDVKSSPFIKPAFKQHALEMGLTCGFLVPMIRDSEIYGQIVYAWRKPRRLNDQARRYLRTMTDLAALALTAYQINRKQEFDPVTGLLNRTGLWRRWELISQAPVGTVLFADVDQFKSVNDTLGHLEGDRFLQDVARILRSTCDPQAAVSRFGGDEFVIAIPDLTPSQAEKLCMILKREVRSAATARKLKVVGISIGRAHWPQDAVTLDELLKIADDGLYQARKNRARRGRIVPLFPSLLDSEL